MNRTLTGIILALWIVLTPALFADTLTFVWDPVTKNEQGDDLRGEESLVAYNLYIADTSGAYRFGDPTLIVGPSQTQTTHTINTVGTYFAVVTAENVFGESAPSEEISFDIAGKPPAKPAGFRFEVSINGSVTPIP